MTPRHDLENTVKGLLGKAERQLLAFYSAEDALPLVSRLRQLVRGLDYSTHRRSMAMFASAGTGKTCYMDMEVEQRLLIDEPFRIRDLADHRKKDKEYLVMTLDKAQSKTYLGHDEHLRLIKSNTPQWASANSFIHQMDLGLGAVLKVYPLPVFIIGPAPETSLFRQITRHPEHIAGYFEKDATDAPESRLLEWLTPRLATWNDTRQRIIRQQIEKALTAGKLISGQDKVKKAAGSRNNRLLVIPRDGNPASRPFYKDGPIDEIAEKVLANGGDIETVDAGLLDAYDHIVIIRYC